MTGILDDANTPEEESFEVTLRPQSFSEFVGQSRVKENLKVTLQAAKKRNESMDHILFHGPPGLGKTTLANIVASESKKNIRITSGPAIERSGDLAAILTSLEDGDILFIDEIHRLHRTIEEMLYPAMEEYAIDLVIGKGPSAKTVRLDLPKFTLVGATTRAALLSSPLRDRFGIIHRLDYYSDADILEILTRSADILKVNSDEHGLALVAARSRRTPRIANRLLKRLRDYAEVKGSGVINLSLAESALDELEIDRVGLDTLDRRIIEAVIEKYKGGPVGLATLAALVHEEPDTIEDIYEPYLMEIGFLERTPRGRRVTDAAYEHLGLKRNLGLGL